MIKNIKGLLLMQIEPLINTKKVLYYWVRMISSNIESKKIQIIFRNKIF